MLSVLDLAYEDTQLSKESVNSLCGPCPNYARGKCRCGENGFVVKWDNSRGEWRFSCRGCWPADEYLPEKGRKRGFGDAIDYLRHFRDMSFQNAKALANDGETPTTQDAPTQPKQQAGYTTDAWQKRTDEAVNTAIDTLWKSDDTSALEYIRSRGFIDDTITWARMGFSLKDGIPRLIIPSINDGRYVTVYRRDLRPDVPKDKRWIDASGGTKSELYLADCLKRKLPTVLVESPLCALSILQEYGRDNINAVATGSSKGARSPKSLARLARMPLVLVAFDADKAGDDDADYWLKLQNAHPLRPLLKDVNDMLVDGWDIKEWIEQAIAKHLEATPTPEQPEVDASHQEPEEEQPPIEETVLFTHDDAPLPRGDFWTGVHARLARSSIAGGTSFHETLQNWRPDEKMYAHFPGGYEGYCRMYRRKGEAA